jgi:hypothetical protein
MLRPGSAGARFCIDPALLDDRRLGVCGGERFQRDAAIARLR